MHAWMHPIDFRPHLGSILISTGTQKHWFCTGGVYKINIFIFFILNIIWTRFSINFGLLGASKIDQKSYASTEGAHLRSVLSAKMPSRPNFGAQTTLKDLFKTLFGRQASVQNWFSHPWAPKGRDYEGLWNPRYPLRPFRTLRIGLSASK